ncbi:MAG: hypothetical protein WDN31_04810 [Hyphomicrobium sp.]
MQRNVLTQLAGRLKGILLFHDIQPSTAHALPALLAELRKRGFMVVHLVPKADARTLPNTTPRPPSLLAHKVASAKTPLSTRALTWSSRARTKCFPGPPRATAATQSTSAQSSTGPATVQRGNRAMVQAVARA